MSHLDADDVMHWVTYLGPLNKKSSPPGASDKPESDGFTKVTNCRKNHKKAATNPRRPQANASKPLTSNNFAALANELVINPDNSTPPERGAKKDKQPMHTKSIMIPADPMINDPFSSAKHKAPKWYLQGIEEDIREPDSRTIAENNEE